MQTSMAHAIETLVELLIPRFSPQDTAFHVVIDARMTIYGENSDRGLTKEIHFLFQRPNNYTKVFFFMTDKHLRLKEIPSDAWELKVDHDSCWRDAIQSPLFKVWCDMRDEISPSGKEKISEFIRFDLFNKPQLVKVKLTPQGEYGYNRTYLITQE